MIEVGDTVVTTESCSTTHGYQRGWRGTVVSLCTGSMGSSICDVVFPCGKFSVYRSNLKLVQKAPRVESGTWYVVDALGNRYKEPFDSEVRAIAYAEDRTKTHRDSHTVVKVVAVTKYKVAVTTIKK